MSALHPFTWRVGIDNCFGWLIAPTGERRLVETHLFHAARGVVVDLRDGQRQSVPADGRLLWQPLAAEAACAIAGIPAPEVDGAAELARRVDPFHVERHRSPLFRALVALIRERTLPCGYSLHAALTEGWDRTYRDACEENPEAFAAAVNERVGAGAHPIDACRAELAAEADLTLEPADLPSLARLLVRTGWAATLTGLPDRIAAHTDHVAPHAAAAADDTSQLALL